MCQGGCVDAAAPDNVIVNLFTKLLQYLSRYLLCWQTSFLLDSNFLLHAKLKIAY